MFNQKLTIILAVVLILLLAVGIYFVLKKSIVDVIFVRQNLTVKAEVVETTWEQAKGLMYRKELADNAGMLFVFSAEAPRAFWMKNVDFPLDLIFISKDKIIKEIKVNFKPCPEGIDCPIYRSQHPIQYVLEVKGGFCEKYGIEVGDLVEINLVKVKI